MNRKALGRGLSALLGEESDADGSEQLLELDIDSIVPNKEQPRTSFQEESLNELAQSIKINGVVQPIIVRKKGRKYELVAGERRWRASQKAGLKTIPAIVKNIGDEKILEIALIENIQRHDLNAIEEARAYKNLIENIGLTQEMVAERVGKNRTVITTSLRLLKLPDDILKLIEEEKISAGHGRALLMNPEPETQRKIVKAVMEMSLSVRDTEKAVKRSTRKEPEHIENKSVKINLDANERTAETKLKRYLSTNIKIAPDGKGTGGKIEIEYYGTDDLTRIYDLIIKAK